MLWVLLKNYVVFEELLPFRFQWYDYAWLLSYTTIVLHKSYCAENDGIGPLLIINPSSSTAFPLNNLVTGNVSKVHLPQQTSLLLSSRLIKYDL